MQSSSSQMSMLPPPITDPDTNMAPGDIDVEPTPDAMESDDDWKVKTPIVDIPLQKRGENRQLFISSDPILNIESRYLPGDVNAPRIGGRCVFRTC